MGNNTPNPHPYWGRALQYQQGQQQGKAQIKQQQQQGKHENKPRDYGGFDSLVVGRECVIKLGNGEILKGIVSAASKYFYLVNTGGQVMIVNKAYVVSIIPTQTQQNNNNGTGDTNVGKAPNSK
jgi:sRNA-binding regulator protein Hfq